MGEVVRRYIDLLLLLIPTPLVSVSFFIYIMFQAVHRAVNVNFKCF